MLQKITAFIASSLNISKKLRKKSLINDTLNAWKKQLQEKVLPLSAEELEMMNKWIDYPVLVSHWDKRHTEYQATQGNTKQRALKLLDLVVLGLSVLLIPCRKADLVNAVVMTKAEWLQCKANCRNMYEDIPRSCLFTTEGQSYLEIAFHKNE